MAGVIAVVVLLTSGVLLVCAAITASTQARTAADLAALAAAADQVAGAAPQQVCDTARRVSELNRARLVSCRPTADGVEVVVGVEARPVSAARLIARPAHARARAGPDPSGAVVAAPSGTIDP